MPKSWFEQVDSGEVKPQEKSAVTVTPPDGKRKSWFDNPTPPSKQEESKSSGLVEQGKAAVKTAASDLMGMPKGLLTTAGKAILAPVPEEWRPKWAQGETPVQDLGGSIIHEGQDIAQGRYGEAIGHAGAAYVGAKALGKVPEAAAKIPEVSPVVKAGVKGGVQGGVAALPEAARGMFYGSVGGKLLGGTPGAEIGAAAGGMYPLARGVVRGAKTAMTEARGLPPEGASTTLPKSILRQPSALPDSAPRVSPTLSAPKPQAPEPSPLQRQMPTSVTRRLPTPIPGSQTPVTAEPSPLQRQMPTSAQRVLPMPKPIPLEEPEPAPAQAQTEPISQPEPKPVTQEAQAKPVRQRLPAAPDSRFPSQISPGDAQGLSRSQLIEMIHGRGMEIGVTNESMMREWAMDNYGLSLGNMEKPQLVNFYNQVLNKPGAPPVGPPLTPKGARKFSPIPPSGQ